MRKLALTLAALALSFGFAAPAFATEGQDGPSFETCENLASWYTNPDENDRTPTATEDGLKFTGSNLIHHEVTGLTVADLQPGTYALAAGSAEPDQPSFFSVEVTGEGPGKYATLRWNPTSEKWQMTTGGQFYENASPAALIAMPPTAKGDRVMSFGIGYTANPPGTVPAVVKSVRFNNATWDLTCKPKPSPSASSSSPTPSASVSTSASASPSASASATSTQRPSSSPAAPVAGPSLPVTGSGGTILGVGAAFVGLGVLAIAYGVRRRRTRFTA